MAADLLRRDLAADHWPPTTDSARGDPPPRLNGAGAYRGVIIRLRVTE